MIKGLLAALAAAAMLVTQNAGLKIVVISGEGGVNIIQQKTAVSPVIEVRDRNNLPVAGASVTFSMGGGGATFGSASTLTVTTNALGQATAAGLTPTTTGAIHINVAAAFQGQTATAAITQTNVLTAAQAASAAGSGAGGGAGGGGGSGAAAGSAGGAAAGGGGISAMTLGIIGAGVAGGAAAVVKTGVIGGAEGFIKILGEVFTTYRGGSFSAACSAGQTAPRECFGDPVAGAIVSTSLDSNTATTGANGYFDLTTTLPLERIEECISYTLTIAAAGYPTYSIATRGFSGNKRGDTSRGKFTLSPPTPTIMAGC